MNYLRLLYVLSSIFYSLTIAKEIPDYLHICKKNDPAVQKCFRKSVLALRPYLTKGIPDLNIPTIEPLYLKELLVAEPTGGSQGVKVSANNIKVYGCTDYDIKNINIDFDAGRMNFDIILKHLYIDGKYAIDGRILLFPVSGEGKVVGNFTNCIGVCKMDTEMAKKNGEEYVKVKNIDLKIKVGKGSIHLYNLFGGDGLLGDVINNVINQNFDSFSKELFPALERELSSLLLELTNSILSQFTYRQLFPVS